MSLFITFEGGEGSGKTTVIKEIEKMFVAEGITNYIVTREPGGIQIAEEIRSIILNKKNTMMDKRTEALLFAASRRQHLKEKIVPALNKGYIVLCDRYLDSSLVYQGIARDIGVDNVCNINLFAIDTYLPDITFLLDIDPIIGLERINKNKNRELNRLDLETLDFHKKIREGYLYLAKMYPKRIKKINANRPVKDIAEEIFKIIIKHTVLKDKK